MQATLYKISAHCKSQTLFDRGVGGGGGVGAGWHLCTWFNGHGDE